MNYLIAGLAKSGTTILFSRLQTALDADVATYFEPDQDKMLREILDTGRHQDTLTKVLIGRVGAENSTIHHFDRHVLIYRDPRDRFISMLLYLFYDFQVNGDAVGYRDALAALKAKISAPADHSTVTLYNHVAALVGRAPFNVFKNLHIAQRAYLQEFSPCLLRYEDFIEKKLTVVEAYLGVSLNNAAEVANDYDRVARSKAYGEWRDWLTNEDLDYVQSEWGDTLTELGYPACTGAENLHINTHTSLNYVSQFDPSLTR